MRVYFGRKLLNSFVSVLLCASYILVNIVDKFLFRSFILYNISVGRIIFSGQNTVSDIILLCTYEYTHLLSRVETRENCKYLFTYLTFIKFYS